MARRCRCGSEARGGADYEGLRFRRRRSRNSGCGCRAGCGCGCGSGCGCGCGCGSGCGCRAGCGYCDRRGRHPCRTRGSTGRRWRWRRNRCSRGDRCCGRRHRNCRWHGHWRWRRRRWCRGDRCCGCRHWNCRWRWRSHGLHRRGRRRRRRWWWWWWWRHRGHHRSRNEIFRLGHGASLGIRRHPASGQKLPVGVALGLAKTFILLGEAGLAQRLALGVGAHTDNLSVGIAYQHPRTVLRACAGRLRLMQRVTVNFTQVALYRQLIGVAQQRIHCARKGLRPGRILGVIELDGAADFIAGKEQLGLLVPTHVVAKQCRAGGNGKRCREDSQQQSEIGVAALGCAPTNLHISHRCVSRPGRRCERP